MLTYAGVRHAGRPCDRKRRCRGRAPNRYATAATEHATAATEHATAATEHATEHAPSHTVLAEEHRIGTLFTCFAGTKALALLVRKYKY